MQLSRESTLDIERNKNNAKICLFTLSVIRIYNVKKNNVKQEQVIRSDDVSKESLLLERISKIQIQLGSRTYTTLDNSKGESNWVKIHIVSKIQRCRCIFSQDNLIFLQNQLLLYHLNTNICLRQIYQTHFTKKEKKR